MPEIDLRRTQPYSVLDTDVNTSAALKAADAINALQEQGNFMDLLVEKNEPNFDFMKFGKAFSTAREMGLKVFNWRGKKYNTLYEEELPKVTKQQFDKLERKAKKVLTEQTEVPADIKTKLLHTKKIPQWQTMYTPDTRKYLIENESPQIGREYTVPYNPPYAAPYEVPDISVPDINNEDVLLDNIYNIDLRNLSKWLGNKPFFTNQRF